MGTKVSLRDLHRIAAKVNALYRRKGAIAAVAVLPEQDITGGAVQIRLVEGRLGAVEVKGARFTKKGFVSSRVDAREGELVDAERVRKSLERLNATYDITSRLVMMPGKTEGTTDYLVSVDEPANYTAAVFTDNAGKEETGLYRAGTVVTDRSVTGHRDAFTFGTVGSHGSESVFGSYDIPVNRFGTKLGTSADWSKTSIKKGEMKDLDVGGSYKGAGFSVTHPFVAAADRLVNAYAKYDYKRSTSEFDGNQTMATRVESVAYGFDATLRGNANVLVFDNSFTNGYDHHENVNRRFMHYNAALTGAQGLGKVGTVILKGRGQLSDDTLLPSTDQFQVGGSATVRGYTEGLLTGDNGYVLTAEFERPLFSSDKVKWFAFYDNGRVCAWRGDAQRTLNHHSLASFGGGLAFSFTKYFSARVTYAVPAVDHPFEDDTHPQWLYSAQLAF